MSIKDIKEAHEKGSVVFGVKQTIKHFDKKKSSKSKVFLAKDARPETMKKLEDAKISFEHTKTKAEIAKELNLDFEAEVYLLN